MDKENAAPTNLIEALLDAKPEAAKPAAEADASVEVLTISAASPIAHFVVILKEQPLWLQAVVRFVLCLNEDAL